MRRVVHWINGKPYPGVGDRTVQVFDPSRGLRTGEVTLAAEADVDAAVASASEAWLTWRNSSLTRRQRILFSLRETLEKHKKDVARAITSEHGKTLDDALGEVQRGIEVVEFACGIPHLVKGEYSEQVSRGVDTYSLRQSIGVCAGITPFNFPAMVPMWMFPMAIACGNTFILKPSEKDPTASLLLADMASRAGLPDGVLNVVQGDKVAVDRLLRHPDVAAVSFVGSTPIASYVYEVGAAHGKRVQALGGAKNHMIVMPDADMGLAADAAVSAGYGSAGERCMAISIVVCVGDAADRLIPEIERRIAGLKVGPGDLEDTDMGPLVTDDHRETVVTYIATGERAGADLVVDGRELQVPDYPGGFYLGPTLFDNVREDMAIYRDEIFGPVLGVVRVDSHSAAIDVVNANPYGNGTAIFTNDGGAARMFQNEIQVGMVGINVPIPVPLSFYSFGGWKASIFGAHAVYGPESIHFYTRQKVLISRWPTPAQRGLDLSFPQHGSDE